MSLIILTKIITIIIKKTKMPMIVKNYKIKTNYLTKTLKLLLSMGKIILIRIKSTTVIIITIIIMEIIKIITTKRMLIITLETIVKE